jgi:Holliday junction resolvase RusA-like endonuclease
MREKKYTIPLKPLAWKRAGISGTKFYDQQVNEKIAFGLYLLKQHGSDPIFENAVAIDIIFYMSTAQQKIKQKKIYHSTTPDLSNLIKFLEDAIVDTRAILTDDRIISVIIAKKVYDNKDPRTEFTIRELE